MSKKITTFELRFQSGLESVDGALPRFPVEPLVGDFGKPLPCLAVHILYVRELPQGPEVLAHIPDGTLHFPFIEKRALQTVAVVEHKFLPSRTLFIR